MLAATVAVSASTAAPAIAADPGSVTSATGGGVASASTDGESARLDGIDVSHWQGTIGWGKVARDGVEFAIAKATEGTYFVDGQYARNKARSVARGLFFTAYHYARPSGGRSDAIHEADWFVRHADLGPGNLVPALDLETSGRLGHRALRRWTLAWLGRVEARLGVKPMIYTTPAFWEYYLRDSRAIARQGYQVLWIAHWGANHPRVPARDWNGNSWTYWQWTARGDVNGIRGNVDRNWFSGNDLGVLTIRTLRRAAAD
ncbi:MAG: glycoside hydrolase family 25 protein [Candidatus Limnocylindrales bacterium]